MLPAKSLPHKSARQQVSCLSFQMQPMTLPISYSAILRDAVSPIDIYIYTVYLWFLLFISIGVKHLCIFIVFVTIQWHSCFCSFSHTNRSFRVLGHQCVVKMGNCLIWISLCMFFFPLIETVTYTCHYMTDRLERFDLKTSKLDLLKKKRHLHLGCPWGKLIDTKF